MSNPVAGVSGNTTLKVFIATARAPSTEPGVLCSDARASELGLASAVVSIPPNHITGNIERALRLPPDPETEFTIVDPLFYR
jgi:esterase/lipase superfamily enzyme